MNSKKHAPDISYFRLSLTAFLKESHPERLEDNRFILSCADAATEAYEQTIRNGGTPPGSHRTGKHRTLLRLALLQARHSCQYQRGAKKTT
jgi:hypothetical protein